MSTPDLRGKVCLVAGASRGVGRGIALGLAEAGATVIVSARSSEAGPRTEMRPETIEEVSREVDAAGGDGHHYVCNHASERSVDQLVHWALRRFGRIDVAISSIWGGNEGFDGERYDDGAGWGTPFWRRSSLGFRHFQEIGPQPSLLLARAVAPAMVAMKSGLIVFVSFESDGAYLGDFNFDLAKATTNRMAFACAEELKPYGVTALALAPGFVRTERVVELGQEGEATESPLYAGRALAALAADPGVAERAGRVVHVADLARHYGYTDLDGRQPERYRPVAP